MKKLEKILRMKKLEKIKKTIGFNFSRQTKSMT
jgi:hypothetical protein